jgi:hypothetical protein
MLGALAGQAGDEVNNNLREILNGPIHTGKWTIYWCRRHESKIRRYMKIFWLVCGVVMLISFVLIGALLGALIFGV